MFNILVVSLHHNILVVPLLHNILVLPLLQDIKDHLREAGDVYYAEVYGDGTGIVEFARQKDSEYACKNLDNTKFKCHEVQLSCHVTYVLRARYTKLV